MASKSFADLLNSLLGALVGGVAAALLVIYYIVGKPMVRPDKGDELQSTAAQTEIADQPSPLDKVAQDIKHGGYILYFRHGQRQKWDSVIAFDVYEMATGAESASATYKDAVCLTPQGVEEGKMIGKILDLAGVPVKMVVSSPSCRAMQTAHLAFGRIDQISAGLAHTPVTNPSNIAEFGAEIKRVLLSVPAGPGEVTVITAHGNTLEHHPDLFSAGAELLNPLLDETGFYVVQRDANKRLRIVQRFQNLGVFAANAINLQAVPASFSP